MKENSHGDILQIGNCLVSEEIVTEFFACDYDRCRGCCCVVGDSGAPMKEEEAEEIEKNYDSFSPLMTAEGRASAEANGFFQIDRDGEMVTPVVSVPRKIEGLDIPQLTSAQVGSKGFEDCAYIHYEKDPQGRTSCFCAVERAFCLGHCSFRKPVSCRLYPIRVSRLRNGMDALNLHRWDICSDAFKKGKKEGIRVYQFLKEPITEVYGSDFYDALDAASKHFSR